MDMSQVETKSFSGKAAKASCREEASSVDMRETEDFFEDAELRLEELCERMGQLQKKLKMHQPHTDEVLETQFQETHHWLKTHEQKMERLIDTGELKLHLAKMDAQDRLAGVIEQIDRVRNEVNTAKVHTDIKIGNVLKKISDSCLNLRRILVGDDKY